MSRDRTERSRSWLAGKTPPHATILFGSVAPDASARHATRYANVRETCETIGLARSTFYHQSRRSAAAMELEHRIVLRLHELRKRFPKDGYRRMTEQLLLEGFRVNRKRIARLMQVHGLNLPASKPRTGVTNRRPSADSPSPRPTLRVTRPRQIWITDITYARVGSRVVYVAAVIDPWSREVKGYAVSLQINPRLASLALHASVQAHRPAPGSVHHSTCGTQYVMRGYTELLRQYGIVPAPAEAGYPLDRATVDSFQITPSHRIIEMTGYETWQDVIDRVQEFIGTLYSPEQIDQILRQHSW